VLRHENIAQPVQIVVLNWQAPADSLMKPLTQPNYWQWATVIFWAGVAFLGFRLLMQLFSMFLLYRRSAPACINDHDVRLIDGEAAPFSFWHTIYVNPANHTPADLKAILLHEQVHVDGWHTVDILLAELSSVFYWFNPGIWLMKKAVRENIEFITDRKILNKGYDSKAYQYSLVNVSFNSATPSIVNHFNISTIKKRIIMMNAKRSSKLKLTRYAFVVPAVVLLLLVFSLSRADVTKPITHKIVATIKPFTLALKQATKTVLALTDTVPAKKPELLMSKIDTVKKTQTVEFTLKLDTEKKQRLLLRSSNEHIMDSMNIVLNGKKVDKVVFSKVDPATIESIYFVNTNDKRLNSVKEYNVLNNKGYVFIATKDSEQGKAIADKLGKSQVTYVTIDGVNKASGTLTTQEPGKINALPGLQGTVNHVTIAGNGSLSYKPEIYLKEIIIDSAVRVRGKGSESLTLNGSNKNVVVKGFRSNLNYVYTTNNGSVSQISDKLIVVDGQIATEKQLKKLSAFDIDRMTTSNNADTVEKYGEKAKNGVVFIYTKKSKQ
jgi:bla regulator protein BlaR1